jgi:UDP-N-acetylmuramoyl-tripeptide--D-alanyl-D-alanine ligase
LFAFGELAQHAVQGFGDKAKSFSDQPAMINAISGEMNADVTLLVKGSRLMHMERVVYALTVNVENR